MRKHITTILLACIFTFALNAQTYYINEDFSGGIPDSWTIDSSSATNPWMSASSFNIEGNTIAMDGKFALTHDSSGTQDIEEIMITSSFDASATDTLILEYDYLFGYADFLGGPFHGYVEIYNGNKWETLMEETSIVTEVTHDSINISDYIHTNTKIRFRLVCSNGSSKDYGFAVDNIEVYAPTSTGYNPSQINKDLVTVRPNPFESSFTVNLSEPQKITLTLYNALGAKVRRISTKQSSKEIQMERKGLRSGVYILEITNQKTGEILEKRKMIAK